MDVFVAIHMSQEDAMLSARIYLALDFLSQSLTLMGIEMKYSLSAGQAELPILIAEPRARLDPLRDLGSLRQRQVQARMRDQPTFVDHLTCLFEARHVRHERATGTEAQLERPHNGQVDRVIGPKVICVDNQADFSHPCIRSSVTRLLDGETPVHSTGPSEPSAHS
jgi:hypothetical protein